METVPLEKSSFVTPYSILFQLDGATRRWDAVESHASVAVLLYRPAPAPAVILVRQFRPAVSGALEPPGALPAARDGPAAWPPAAMDGWHAAAGGSRLSCSILI